jgi:phosphatidylserine/phosphatidylglycerophosphate/cardiolipin synthase-like enzyme
MRANLNARCQIGFGASLQETMPAPAPPTLRWLRTGRGIFPAMLQAIGAAQKSIQLETYIYTHGQLGRQFLEALLAAARRGVRVSVLVDAVGSWFLPGELFAPLVAAGAEVRRFNPLRLWRFGVRDHRKLLVLNYELMLRFEDKTVAREAHEIFEEALKYSRKIELQPWANLQTYWQRWKNHWAHFLLARINPFAAPRQFHLLKN